MPYYEPSGPPLWYSMLGSAIVLVIVFVLLGYAQGQNNTSIPDWENMPSHEVPHCDIPPRAAKSPGTVAPCRCPGMVHNVQAVMIVDCWAVAGWLMPDDPMLRELIISTPSAEVLECLGNVADHCSVVANNFPWTPELDRVRDLAYKSKNTCMTSCKPERCGCADEACKSHGSGAYGQSSGTSDQGVPNTVEDYDY